MKKIVILILLLLTGCTEFLVDINTDNDWLIKEKGNFVIHYRKFGATSSPSPTDTQVDIIAGNQNRYLHYINDTLGINYNEKILIYLYNKSEAKDIIGTNGGGHSEPDVNTYYYTFKNIPFFDGTDTAFIGSHELVHVMTHKLLGLPGTKMMSEGYAVALSEGYGLTYDKDSTIVPKTINMWMRQYYEEDKILSPYDLLNNEDLPERIYYPNAGSFVRYLFNNFEIEKVNKLFQIERDSFQSEFKKILGIDLDIVSNNYLIFCKQNYLQ